MYSPVGYVSGVSALRFKQNHQQSPPPPIFFLTPYFPHPFLFYPLPRTTFLSYPPPPPPSFLLYSEDMVLLASGVPVRTPRNCEEIADLCLSLRTRMRSVCLEILPSAGIRVKSGFSTGMSVCLSVYLCVGQSASLCISLSLCMSLRTWMSGLLLTCVNDRSIYQSSASLSLSHSVSLSFSHSLSLSHFFSLSFNLSRTHSHSLSRARTLSHLLSSSLSLPLSLSLYLSLSFSLSLS